MKSTLIAVALAVAVKAEYNSSFTDVVMSSNGGWSVDQAEISR
jgi:hypothetical protein